MDLRPRKRCLPDPIERPGKRLANIKPREPQFRNENVNASQGQATVRRAPVPRSHNPNIPHTLFPLPSESKNKHLHIADDSAHKKQVEYGRELEGAIMEKCFDINGKRVLTHEQTMYMAKVGESIGLKITQSKWMELYKRLRINRTEIGSWSTDCVLPPDVLQKISMVKMFDEKLERQHLEFLPVKRLVIASKSIGAISGKPDSLFCYTLLGSAKLVWRWIHEGLHYRCITSMPNISAIIKGELPSSHAISDQQMRSCVTITFQEAPEVQQWLPASSESGKPSRQWRGTFLGTPFNDARLHTLIGDDSLACELEKAIVYGNRAGLLASIKGRSAAFPYIPLAQNSEVSPKIFLSSGIGLDAGTHEGGSTLEQESSDAIENRVSIFQRMTPNTTLGQRVLDSWISTESVPETVNDLGRGPAGSVNAAALNEIASPVQHEFGPLSRVDPPLTNEASLSSDAAETFMRTLAWRCATNESQNSISTCTVSIETPTFRSAEMSNRDDHSRYEITDASSTVLDLHLRHEDETPTTLPDWSTGQDLHTLPSSLLQRMSCVALPSVDSYDDADHIVTSFTRAHDTVDDVYGHNLLSYRGYHHDSNERSRVDPAMQTLVGYSHSATFLDIDEELATSAHEQVPIEATDLEVVAQDDGSDSRSDAGLRSLQNCLGLTLVTSVENAHFPDFT